MAHVQFQVPGVTLPELWLRTELTLQIIGSEMMDAIDGITTMPAAKALREGYRVGLGGNLPYGAFVSHVSDDDRTVIIRNVSWVTAEFTLILQDTEDGVQAEMAHDGQWVAGDAQAVRELLMSTGV